MGLAGAAGEGTSRAALLETRRRVEGEVNTNDGGRGLSWDDPDGHSLEIITVPYGGGA